MKSLGVLFASQAIVAMLQLHVGETTKVPEVEVWLGESIEKLKGKIWPRSKIDGGVLPSCGFEDPCVVSVCLPNGHCIKTYSDVLWLGQTEGIVRGVSLMPLAKTVPFAAALARVEELGKDLKISTDQNFSHLLNEMRKEKQKKYYFGLDLPKGVGLGLVTEYDPRADGWSIVLDLTIPRLYGIKQKE